jgi:hypothetical protein
MTVLRRTNSAVAAFAMTVALLIPAAAHAAPSPSLSIPVAGTASGGGTFSGVFTLTSFNVRDGQVVALGTVSGVVTNAAGIVGSGLTTVAVPAQVTGSCDILHLDLGPLALNLLGLRVDLSQVVLDITAETGAGNLLGNLLCAVTGLLDSPGGLARLLNQILGAL